MPATVSLTERDVLVALRAFLLSVLPPGVEVVDAQDNRVGEPQSDNYVLMNATMRARLGTNLVAYSDVPGAGVRDTTQATLLTIQLDVHGPGDNSTTPPAGQQPVADLSAEIAQVISTLMRSSVACEFFAALGIDVAPLHASEPVQTPFINGEAQYETRWTIDAAFQANIVVGTPQQFAGTLTVTPIPADLGAAALSAVPTPT